ncbi:Os06g0670633, partial [Oryza sativa Japonica Group]
HALHRSTDAPENGYSGAMATLDVYNFPYLKKMEVSAAIVRVSNYQDEATKAGLNDIQAGWVIDPTTYGDSKTHFFVSWTADYYNKTGCFNLDCDGFVPVNGAPVTPGDTLEQANNQTKISFKIFKDKNDGDWWLYFGYDINNLNRVGFWPKNIFNRMVDHATRIRWAGYAQSYKGSSSPPMGNGQFPGKMSASFQNVMYVDTDGQPYPPPVWPAGLEVYASNTKCYQASIFEDNMFYYVGPGSCTS